MAGRGIATIVVAACAVAAAWPARAGSHEGLWIGALMRPNDPIFVRVTLGGEPDALAGRIDFPQAGERAILLKDVTLRGHRLGFAVPGRDGDLRFDGILDGDRIDGVARQGPGAVTFELVRGVAGGVPAFDELVGHYEFAPGEVLLILRGMLGPMFVDYRSGRLGSLHALADGRYVAGPALASGYPVDIAIRPERDASGRLVAVAWTQDGRTLRAGRRVLYRTEPAEFTSGDVTLSGTLLLPFARGPHPAVVMVHGSGPATRDTLLPVADAIVRQGVAVLIHDKRGTGRSTGSHGRATFDDLASDALAAVAWLRAHPEIDPRQIGLQGASLGGWVAPLAAARDGGIAFVMVDAAPATTPAEHEVERVQRQMRADGRPGSDIGEAIAFMHAKFEVGRTGIGWDALERQMARGRQQGWIQYVNAPTTLEGLRWNWQHILSYDPRPALQALRCPVLALYGERDTIVAPEVHVARMQQALAQAATRDSTVQVVTGANHNFFAAASGGPAEVGSLREFAGGFFDARLRWLRARVTGRRGPAAGDGDAVRPDPALFQR